MTILGAMLIAFAAVFYIIICCMEKETDELMQEIYWTESSAKNKDGSRVHNVHLTKGDDNNVKATTAIPAYDAENHPRR